MKVVYKKTILEKIDEEILESYRQNKEIEKIILSREEREKMCNEVIQMCICPITDLELGDKMKYKGIPILIELEDEH